jgi:heme/copper-type cytochrome/quinol oxidase subunit 1
MALKMAKCFITAALLFFLIGCLEGLMFPSLQTFRKQYAVGLHVPPEQIKPFFNHFLTKIHVHITLLGWVSSALMGMIYLIAPHIGGSDRSQKWAAYANLISHIGGVLLMTLGFHLIGIYGLTSGAAYGTPEFNQEVGTLKLFVFFGGLLTLISGVLFSYNTVRSSFGIGRPFAEAKHT